MKRWFLTPMCILVSACGGSVNSDEVSQQDPVYICDANPAIEVDMLGASEIITSMGNMGAITFFTFTTHCDVIMKHLCFDLQGIDANQFVVGSKGTPYFTDWHMMSPTGKTVMGPIEFPKSLASSSSDSGPMVLDGQVSVALSKATEYNLMASFSQTEDSPGEFTTLEKQYTAFWNDGKRPFETGDVTYSDGVNIPLERITASTVLYTSVDMKPVSP